jgi:hypothetical protein
MPFEPGEGEARSAEVLQRHGDEVWIKCRMLGREGYKLTVEPFGEIKKGYIAVASTDLRLVPPTDDSIEKIVEVRFQINSEGRRGKDMVADGYLSDYLKDHLPGCKPCSRNILQMLVSFTSDVAQAAGMTVLLTQGQLTVVAKLDEESKEDLH